MQGIIMYRGLGGLLSLNFAMMRVPMMTIAIILMNSLRSSLMAIVRRTK